MGLLEGKGMRAKPESPVDSYDPEAVDWDPKNWEDRRRIERTDQHDDDTLSAEHAQPKDPVFEVVPLAEARAQVARLWGEKAASQWEDGLRNGKS